MIDLYWTYLIIKDRPAVHECASILVFKWTVSIISSDPLQRWQWYLVHRNILKNFVWSSINEISLFKSLKADFFQLWFPCKSDFHISTAGKQTWIIRIEYFKTQKKNNIFFVIEQITKCTVVNIYYRVTRITHTFPLKMYIFRCTRSAWISTVHECTNELSPLTLLCFSLYSTIF